MNPSHTEREIWQQPSTWTETARLMASSASAIGESLAGAHAVVLTGSGTSQYVAECAAPAIQQALGVPAAVAGGGAILANADQVLPAGPSLMVSVARSGDSPESHAAIELALSARPEMRHLIITCNEMGRIATSFKNEDRVRVITLDPRTNDRSLVMTSSATNLALAAQSLAYLDSPESYRRNISTLSRAAAHLLDTHAAPLCDVARSGFHRAVFLGTGTRYGAAREASLKLLEMTAGRIPTLAETYLGLRHGPMSFVHHDTLVVCFLSSAMPARAYELDLIRELNLKQLGSAKVIVGENVPKDLCELCIECPGLAEAGDDLASVVHIVAAQLIAMNRSLAEGFNPDAPSESNVITRVVPEFQIYEAPRHR